MGKGSKNSKSSKKEAAAPKCTCDDPYTCTCGNRPPRPSKGHKWYPETQEWAGKGHKQKGASGQTSAVALPETTVGSTTVSQWQKLPSQLLDQICEKEGRPRAKYKSIGNNKYRVIVQDAKVARRGTDHDLIFVPAAPSSSDEIAKEDVALLALLHMTPSLPHERKLPEPYKTTWLQAVEASKQSKTKGNDTAGKNKTRDTSKNDTWNGDNNRGHRQQRHWPWLGTLHRRQNGEGIETRFSENDRPEFDATRRFAWQIEIILYSCQPNVDSKWKPCCAVTIATQYWSC